MCRELGRGAYGVVVLMDLRDGSGDGTDTIAVKAQAPTDCLAWECEVLRRLQVRTNEKVGTYAFPTPFSFISLADGAILSMTAGSGTGFNLVDLTNIYKLKLGEHVPELVALHYVSRMLRHLEQLHWHGKILHCDVKPDNFVMCTLDCVDNRHRDIEFSDLMLVDFGRAVDLDEYADGNIEARSVVFRGEACPYDAQCVAMRAGKSWSYDIDTFGVLACAHVLLWGTHIALRREKNGRWSLTNTFKRYWQKELWTCIFDKLLNIDESGRAIGSRARSLRSMRMEIDEYTETESEKLRSFLTRQLGLLPSSRDHLK
jgi:checkpoint serine/threonine-protein kinase